MQAQFGDFSSLRSRWACSSDTVAGQSSEPRGSHDWPGTRQPVINLEEDGELRSQVLALCGEGDLANEEWRVFLD